jgi:hypothetical protein
VIVPVNGLLGFAATSLREVEYANLAAIARASDETLESLLLTADRFMSDNPRVAVAAHERVRLIERLGFYGVRMCVDMLRKTPSATSTDLSRELTRLSGIDRLLVVLTREFQERTRLLKARSAVAALDHLFLRDACRDTNYLRGRLEEITSGAHEFEEVRLLLDLRAGVLELSEKRVDQRGDDDEDERAAALDRLLGGSGHDAATRLGLPGDASPEDIRATAMHELNGWREFAEHPLTRRSAQIAARTAVRSLEGIIAAQQPRPSHELI